MSRIPLEVRNITKTFGKLRAVDDLSLSFSQGSITSIVGDNGSGKSTLLKVIAGLEKPDRGTVILDNRIQKHRMVHRRYRAPNDLSKAFQHPRVLQPESLSENILIGVRPGLDASPLTLFTNYRAHKAQLDLDKENADSVIRSHGFDPHALPTTLSFGQRRKLELLRIAAGIPRVVLLDEPSAGLDDDATAWLSEFLVQWKNEGRTILLVEHNLHLVENISDRIVTLDHGKVSQDVPKNSWSVDTTKRNRTVLPPARAKRKKEMSIVFEMKNVSGGYDAEPVFRNLSISLAPGEVALLVGPNGSGKSTALKAIAGMLPWSQGLTAIKNAPGKSETPGSRLLGRPYGLSFALQAARVFPDMTVQETLKLAAHRLASADERSAAIKEIVKTIPPLEPWLNARNRELSGGQRQIVSLAQAIITSPTVLLLDEPSAGLTGANYRLMLEILDGVLKKNACILMVEHNNKMIHRFANQIWEFKFGKEPVAYQE